MTIVASIAPNGTGGDSPAAMRVPLASSASTMIEPVAPVAGICRSIVKPLAPRVAVVTWWGLVIVSWSVCALSSSVEPGAVVSVRLERADRAVARGEQRGAAAPSCERLDRGARDAGNVHGLAARRCAGDRPRPRPFATPSVFASSSITAAFASPSTGGEVTATLSRPSCTGPIFARDARGCTRMSNVTPRGVLA